MWYQIYFVFVFFLLELLASGDDGNLRIGTSETIGNSKAIHSSDHNENQKKRYGVMGRASIIGNVANNFNNLVNGQFGRSVNEVSDVSTILDRLSLSRQIVRGLESSLVEVLPVFGDSSKIVGQSAFNGIASTGLSTSFRSSGIFGLAGILQNLSGGVSTSFSSIFDTALRVRFGSFFQPDFIAGFSSSPPLLSDMEPKWRTAEQAVEDAHLLGSQIDALCTIFSGGAQIPFLDSFAEVEASFFSLLGGPGDVTLWTKSVMSLQQLREQLIHLPSVWNLSAKQNDSISSSIETINNLLDVIGSQTGLIDANIFNRMFTSFEELRSSFRSLDGTNLIPLLSIKGIDISSHLGSLSNSVAFPIDLGVMGILKNVTPLSSVDQLITEPILLDYSTMSQLSAIANQTFNDIAIGMLSGIPAILAETVQLGGVLSSVSDGLYGKRTNSMLKRVSDDDALGFVKFVQIEEAMRTVQNLIHNLESPTRLASKFLSSEYLDGIFSNGLTDNIHSGLLGGLTVKKFIDNITQLPRITTLDILDNFKSSTKYQLRRLESYEEEMTRETLSVLSSTAILIDALKIVDGIIKDALHAPCVLSTSDDVMKSSSALE